MTVSQDSFVTALLDPEATVPEGLANPDGAAASKRFDVYRNNVAVSLTEALGTAFPVIKQLVGDAFFDQMASIFLRQHPPSSPLMMFYGAEMPAFLKDFEPAQKIGYLPDMARLELAIRHSYHAADAAPIDPTVLQSTPPDVLMMSHLTLAPAVRLVRSDWPIHAVWMFNKVEGSPKPAMAAEDVLVVRPEYDPELLLLPKGSADFIAGLRAGNTFGEALDTASQRAPDFDLTTTLGILLSGGAITSLKAPT